MRMHIVALARARINAIFGVISTQAHEFFYHCIFTLSKVIGGSNMTVNPRGEGFIDARATVRAVDPSLVLTLSPGVKFSVAPGAQVRSQFCF